MRLHLIETSIAPLVEESIIVEFIIITTAYAALSMDERQTRNEREQLTNQNNYSSAGV